MKKNTRSKLLLTTRTIAYCALLCALSIVFARLSSLTPNAFSRYSIDSLPIFLSGLLFGPLAGGLVGFSADFLGCLFSPFGYNPVLCLPAILYGVFGGLVRLLFLRRSPSRPLIPICLGFVPPALLGSVLYQSVALAYFYRYDPSIEGSMTDGIIYFLSTRSVQFSVILVINVLLVSLLFKTKVFHRMGVWPPKKTRRSKPVRDIAGVREYLASLRSLGSVPGLERISALLEKMGSPEKELRFVHVAGTNGKGSTAAMTASVLTSAGYRTGLFTSPCIERINEQIRTDGTDVSDADLVAVTEHVRRIASTMSAPPTEFEQLCCIAFEHFRRSKCDVVVLEAGMGGELDATNVIPAPEVAVITNVGLDHTEFLGGTLGEIARAKAGIIKKGCDAVLYPSGPEAEAPVRSVCLELGCPLKTVSFDGIRPISQSAEGQRFDLDGRKDLFIPLLGEHQRKNAATAVAVLDALSSRGFDISESALRKGLQTAAWPGRFEIVCEAPLTVIDGGHNPQCFEALAKAVSELPKGKKTVALTGVLADKDYAEMYSSVIPLVSEFVCITPPNPRRLDGRELARHLRSKGASAVSAPTVRKGVEKALALAGKDGLLLCFGSLYSVGEIRAALRKLGKI